MNGEILSTLISLAGILAALAGAAWLARRLRGRLPSAGASPIAIIATRPLGGQHALIIAEAGGQRFLLGLSRGGMTALGRLDAPETHA